MVPEVAGIGPCVQDFGMEFGLPFWKQRCPLYVLINDSFESISFVCFDQCALLKLPVLVNEPFEGIDVCCLQELGHTYVCLLYGFSSHLSRI